MILAAGLSLMAGSAFAQDGGVATLQSPLAKPVEVIAGDGYWNCAASSCTAGGATDQSLTVSACKTIVKAAGPVSSFKVGSGVLPDKLLAKCNGTPVAASK
jgi:hypothetical protein